MIIFTVLLVVLGIAWSVTAAIVYIENEVWNLPIERKMVFMTFAGPIVWALGSGALFMRLFRALLVDPKDEK